MREKTGILCKYMNYELMPEKRGKIQVKITFIEAFVVCHPIIISCL